MEVPGRKTEQLPDALTYTSEEVFKFICDPCRTDGQQLPAAGFCIDCQHYLCDTCYQYHQRPLPMRHHVLQDKSEMPRQKNQTKDTCSEKCQHHGSKPLAYFCKFHDQVGCSVCFAIHHMSCKDIIDVDDIAKGDEENIEFEEVFKLLNDMVTRFDNNKCKKEAIISATEISYTKVKQEISSLRNGMNSCFDRLEEKALNMKDNHVKKFNRISEMCGTAIKELQSLKFDLETLRNSKHSRSVFIKLKKAKQEMKILDDCLGKITEENTAKLYKFEPDQQIKDIKSCIKDLGQLSVIKKPEDMKATHVGDIIVKSLTDKNLACITGMTILSNGQLAITDNINKSVKVLDTEKREITSQLEFPSAPWDITETYKGIPVVVVTFPESKVIQFLSVTAKKLTRSHEIGVKGKCYGIVFTEGQLAVVISDDRMVSIAIIELNGDLVKTIPLNRNIWEKEITMAEAFIAVNPDQKTLYVSGPRNLLCLTKQGEILAGYSEYSGMNGSCVDSVGTVYVCYQKSIHQLTGDCKKIQVLELEDKTGYQDRYQQYYSITFKSREDKLFIGIKDSNVIKVYELE